MEIPGGEGDPKQIPSVVGVWIFFGTTQRCVRNTSFRRLFYVLRIFHVKPTNLKYWIPTTGNIWRESMGRATTTCHWSVTWWLVLTMATNIRSIGPHILRFIYSTLDGKILLYGAVILLTASLRVCTTAVGDNTRSKVHLPRFSIFTTVCIDITKGKYSKVNVSDLSSAKAQLITRDWLRNSPVSLLYVFVLYFFCSLASTVHKTQKVLKYSWTTNQ